MTKKKVFVSYDYSTDKHFKQLLESWEEDPEFEFQFCIEPPLDINTENIAHVKAELTARIHSASHTLVIVGKHANKDDRHAKLIGHKNWINFEIFHSRQHQNKIVAVKLDVNHELPDELLKAHVAWAPEFKKEHVIKALKATV